MRRPFYLRLLRYHDGIDEGHEPCVNYLDEGSFPASIWAASASEQREGERPRHLLFASPKIRLAAQDRLTHEEKTYRVLWARSYTRHTEALIEEEEEPA